mgnify:CR=1 FL=1
MKIKILKEVTSEPQRKYMCAMKDASADERPKDLSKAEADEMCRSEVHEDCGPPMGRLKVNIVRIMKEADDLYIGSSGGFLPSKEEIRKKVVDISLKYMMWLKQTTTRLL